MGFEPQQRAADDGKEKTSLLGRPGGPARDTLPAVTSRRETVVFRSYSGRSLETMSRVKKLRVAASCWTAPTRAFCWSARVGDIGQQYESVLAPEQRRRSARTPRRSDAAHRCFRIASASFCREPIGRPADCRFAPAPARPPSSAGQPRPMKHLATCCRVRPMLLIPRVFAIGQNCKQCALTRHPRRSASPIVVTIYATK